MSARSASISATHAGPGSSEQRRGDGRAEQLRRARSAGSQVSEPSRGAVIGRTAGRDGTGRSCGTARSACAAGWPDRRADRPGSDCRRPRPARQDGRHDRPAALRRHRRPRRPRARHLLRRAARDGGEGRTRATTGSSVTGAGYRIAFQQAPDLQPPDWPDPDRPQQFHLDIRVADVDEAEPKVLALGARRLPGEGGDFRVYADPVGHPFCLVWDA